VPERTVVFLPRAKEDVFEISSRIALDDPGVAERFEAAVRAEAALLRQFPGCGRAREFRGRSFRGLRSRPLSRFRSWLVFYRVRRDVVEIVRVLHGARDLRRALKD
jgi:toxin ParE1/3/4